MAYAASMDFSATNSSEIAAGLSRLGITWSIDDEGDVRVRLRATEPPWMDAAFYELHQDFSIHGHFLDARVNINRDGKIAVELPTNYTGPDPTAVAQKVVTIYFIPRDKYVALQVHAAVDPITSARPMH